MLRNSSDVLRRVLKVVWVVFLAIFPLLVTLVPTLITNSPVLGAFFTTSYILWLLQLLYDHWDLFYFRASRFLLFITNEEVSWTITAEFTIQNSETLLPGILEVVKSLFVDSVVWQNDSGILILKLPIGCTIRAREVEVYEGDSLEAKLDIDLSDIVVPFRRSNVILDETMGLLNSIRIKLGGNEGKYTFRVKFNGPNAYFGLFVRQLRVPKQELRNFVCEFVERIGTERETVQVTQKQISLVTHSIANLNMLSRRYVTLASLDVTNP